MVIRLLDRGTLFDIVSLDEGQDVGLKMQGTLYDTERNTILLLEGDEFRKHCTAKASPGERFSLTFYKGPLECSLQGKFNRTLIKFNSINLVEIEAVSGITERNRRSSPRLDMALPIKLYVQSGNEEKKLVCSGQNYDISAEAVCFLSNTKMETQEADSKFYIEFTLCKYDRFCLPAKMLRQGDARQSIQFKYDYAFTFDYSENPGDKNRLVTSFLKNSIERRG